MRKEKLESKRREKGEERKENLKLEIERQMKINTTHTVNFEDLCVRLSKNAGMCKLLIGAPDVAAVYELKQALYDFKNCSLFRGKAKPLLREIEKAVTTWRTNLRYRLDDNITLFDVKDFDERYKGIYKDGITNNDYFEMWESIGGELYARTLNLIQSVRYKFRLHFEKVGMRHADVMAEVCMASNLMKIAVEAFEFVTKTCMEHLPQMSPKFDVLVGKLNVQPILERLETFIEVVSRQDRGLDENEGHVMKMAISTIADKWSDPEYIHQIQIDMMKEYREDVFNDETYKEELTKQHRLHEELIAELAEEKRKRFGARVKDKRIKEK